MAEIRPVEPVKLFCGIIATSETAADLAAKELEDRLGTIDLRSDAIPFIYTTYYKEEMGDGLIRKFIVFRDLTDPGRLVEIKLMTNDLEERYKEKRNGAECRTVNLDPGYICASRLVLATTKDFSHRVYMGRGIYGEVTANFKKGGMLFHPWSYPDFQSEEYVSFFLKIRALYMKQMREKTEN